MPHKMTEVRIFKKVYTLPSTAVQALNNLVEPYQGTAEEAVNLAQIELDTLRERLDVVTKTDEIQKFTVRLDAIQRVLLGRTATNAIIEALAVADQPTGGNGSVPLTETEDPEGSEDAGPR